MASTDGWTSTREEVLSFYPIGMRITCGCGFSTQTTRKKTSGVVLEEALDHSQKKNHTLTINGLVRKEDK